MALQSRLWLAVLGLPVAAALAGTEQVNIAEDDTRTPAYADGWSDGQRIGHGFTPWRLRSDAQGEGSFAGFFTATPERNRDLAGSAMGGRAWGLFANGRGFESAVAYRTFIRPLEAQDVFSLFFEHGDVKSRSHPGGAAAGITLRSGTASETVADYNRGARLGVLALEGRLHYQLVDADGLTDTGVPLTADGVLLAITILSSDTYTLELQTLGDRKVHRLERRKFSGPAGAPLESFALFSRDNEKSDVFFNGLQVARRRPAP